MNQNTLTLIDFYSVFYKSVLSSKINELTFNNQITGGIYNFIRAYNKIIKNYPNTLFCIDKVITNHRKEIYPKYKANRDLSEYEKKGYNINQWKQDFFNSIPMKYAHHPELEADDIIYSLIEYVNNSSLQNIFHEILVITGDSDLWILKDKNVKIINIKNDYNEVSNNDILLKYQLIDNKKIIFYKSLFGDSSDNIESSLPKGTRKKKFIEYINNYIGNNFNNDIINSYTEINKDQFSINSNIVKLIFKDFNNINFCINNGCEEEYNNIKHKYGFTSLGNFSEFENQLNINNNNLHKYIFNIPNKNEELLNNIL